MDDGWNLVGPWVIGVGESESGVRFGVKGQKNIHFSPQSHDCREGHMKNKFVCLFVCGKVKGQSSKKHQN